MRILLVEDNRRLSTALVRALSEDGYVVDCAFDGREGEEMAELTSPDIIILDVMLPRRDGFEVCRSLRDRRITVPILMLTARDALRDRVSGLDSGADDYLIKPFEMDELRARLRALLRRETDDKSAVLVVDDLILDPATHRVERAGRSIKLTSREYSLLESLVRNKNRIVTREMVRNSLWRSTASVASNAVDVYIRRLRRKIDDPFEKKLIETMRGSGYRVRIER